MPCCSVCGVGGDGTRPTGVAGFPAGRATVRAKDSGGHSGVDVRWGVDQTRLVRRINGERLVLAGWTRAILMQVAHPLIAAGVADHSAFRAGAATSARRLHHTVKAMLNLTFGTTADQQHTLAGIRAIHRRVHGTTRETTGRFPAGTPYSAEDPALVCWVHTTLLESALVTYEALVRPLSDAERDAYCRETAWVAVALGATDEDVPRTWRDVTTRIEGTIADGTLAIGTDARAIARALIDTRLSWLMPFSSWINVRLTAGWLPAVVRAQYGFAWDSRRQRQFRRVVSGLRGARRRLPGPLALWRSARRPVASR